MNRIDEAMLRVRKPNPEWGDDYLEGLEQLSGDSDGKDLEVSIRGGGSNGLSKSRGVIPLITELIRNSASSFRNAVVTGVSGTGVRTVISTVRKTRNEKVTLREVQPGFVDPEDIDSQMSSILNRSEESTPNQS